MTSKLRKGGGAVSSHRTIVYLTESQNQISHQSRSSIIPHLVDYRRRLPFAKEFEEQIGFDTGNKILEEHDMFLFLLWNKLHPKAKIMPNTLFLCSYTSSCYRLFGAIDMGISVSDRRSDMFRISPVKREI